jgi:NAD(P)H-hydrate repair Nnr-like enzyme with NAD(P)H-hydrate dehydratase domain
MIAASEDVQRNRQTEVDRHGLVLVGPGIGQSTQNTRLTNTVTSNWKFALLDAPSWRSRLTG